jgi:hypothetical protein
VCFAFVSDVLKPLTTRFTKNLVIGGFTLSVPSFLGVEFGVIPELSAALIVFCLSVAVLSSLMLFLQRGHEHGALAELVPGIKQLQERLGIIDTKIDKVLESQKRLENNNAELLRAMGDLTRRVVALNAVQTTAATETRVGEAIEDITRGAVEGDERLQTALNLLQSNNVADAVRILQAVAEDKTTRIQQDSKDAAAAYRNLGAIAGLGDPST